ncbi:MAG: HAMP domain-containing histidine kinase, partial [Clostridia bacterium]|nr:HAMP domain-containing histidine kinase [Clostridia bacterium]
MGNAAREYAKGNFKIRVDAEGPDEIAELGKAFNHMAGSLAAHEENRNTFLSNVSHDLRTPMTTISGFVDGMLDGTIPDDQRDHYLQIISGEVRRLSRLVNSLLEVSRLEAGKSLKVSDFNLTERARQVVIALADKIDAKGIDVDFDGDAEDVFVSADPDAIHQVLYNLVDNAVKFTDSGGVIGIRITETKAKDAGGISKDKDKKALVRIRNTGKGIPEEEMKHIFERFYKSDRSRGLDKTGTGLGLYIVKTVLDQHGETIHVESVPDVYTEFRFTLSLAGTSGRKMKVFRFADDGPDEPQTGEPEPQNEAEQTAGEPANSDKDNEKEGYLT